MLSRIVRNGSTLQTIMCKWEWNKFYKSTGTLKPHHVQNILGLTIKNKNVYLRLPCYENEEITAAEARFFGLFWLWKSTSATVLETKFTSAISSETKFISATNVACVHQRWNIQGNGVAIAIFSRSKGRICIRSVILYMPYFQKGIGRERKRARIFRVDLSPVISQRK